MSQDETKRPQDPDPEAVPAAGSDGAEEAPDNETTKVEQTLTGSPLPDWTVSMELVTRAQKGDDESLNDLIGRYWPRVWRVARFRMSQKLLQFADPDDITNEVMATVVRNAKIQDLELRGPSSIINWLSQIAENKIKDLVDHISAQKRNPDRVVSLDAGADEDGPSQAANLAGDDVLPLDQLMMKDTFKLIDEEIASLTEDHREVIIARLMLEADWEYVAEHIGSPNVHAAQEMYRRAIKKLRDKVAPRLKD